MARRGPPVEQVVFAPGKRPVGLGLLSPCLRSRSRALCGDLDGLREGLEDPVAGIVPKFKRVSARGVALAGAADCVDGGLYLFEPLHSLRADCRAPPGGAADSDAGGNRRSRRLAGSRARDWPAAAGRARPLRTFEIDLPRARLRLSRR